MAEERAREAETRAREEREEKEEAQAINEEIRLLCEQQRQQIDTLQLSHEEHRALIQAFETQKREASGKLERQHKNVETLKEELKHTR